jgi:hypothetical protein
MRIKVLLVIFWLGILISQPFSFGQESKKEDWPIPDLKGLTPYSIIIQSVDGVEKIVEKFYTPNGGNVARLIGNGKIFGYAVDTNQEPPIDYLIIDPDGSGKFTQKFESSESYTIPEWVSQ